MRKIMRALAIAEAAHKDQRRKSDASPYIGHPIRICDILAEARVTDEITLAAAACHDTIEDTTITEAELREQLCDETVETIKELTDDKTLPKKERKALEIEHAKELSLRAAQIKIADKLDNCRGLSAHTPESWSQERLQNYINDARQTVANATAAHADNEQIQNLSMKFSAEYGA